MRIVLFGKNGQVGWELNSILPKLGEVTSLGRDDLDVSNTKAVQRILDEIKHDLIINASAFTDVDGAEKDPELATKINALAPAAMAESARKTGASLIHFSTDYVFDGKKDSPYKENDHPNPLNIYGKSKLAGESFIDQTGGAYLILRTSWVYSLRGNTFVNKVLGWARRNKTLKIVSDQISNPTWARELAKATTSIVIQNKANLFEAIGEKSGIYHLAGSGYTSRYEWAKHILLNNQHQTEQLVRSIEPVTSNEFPTPAIRPLFSAMDCSKILETFNIRLPDWRESLQKAMSEHNSMRDDTQ